MEYMENLEYILCECHLAPIITAAIALFYFSISLADFLLEWTMETRWRRKALKFLDNEDIELLKDNLSLSTEYMIGEIVKRAYEKDMRLKESRKQKRKEFLNKLKFWKRKDK